MAAGAGIAETPEELFARALAAADGEGRLPMPPVETWETFPFEGDLRTRPLLPPLPAEQPRHGEGGVGCRRCELEDADVIWSDDRWVLTSLGEPSGLPVVVVLHPRAHHDLGDLPADLAAELGPLLVRVERAVASVGEIGRVHVCRWGDGSEHLHVWFLARPARLPQTVGSFAAIWHDILPPLPHALWRANLADVAAALGA
jgi:diadenosine tetraphosphate (Ap4A) HIT family hydrolase